MRAGRKEWAGLPQPPHHHAQPKRHAKRKDKPGCAGKSVMPG